MHRSQLRCGTVLHFRRGTSLPSSGDVVPCHRHGYCRVSAGANRGSSRHAERSRRLSDAERRRRLIDALQSRPVLSVHALRRHNVTLRTLAAAADDGLVELDLVAGMVAARTRQWGG